MVEKYNKLVRDKIPEIIQAQGDLPKTKVLDDGDYFIALNQKLKEEVAEYLEAYSLNELADILEVVYAIAAYKGMGKAGLEQIRQKKADERGAFANRIALVEVVRRDGR